MIGHSCNRFTPGSDYTPDQCRKCWRYHHDAEFRAKIDDPSSWNNSPPSSQPAIPPRPACLNRGPEPIEQIECPTCAGHVRVKAFACAVHGRCTVGKPLPDVACCAVCRDHISSP